MQTKKNGNKKQSSTTQARTKKASGNRSSTKNRTGESSGKTLSEARTSSEKAKGRKSGVPRRQSSSRGSNYLIAAILILLGAVFFLMLFTFSALDMAPDAETTLNLFGKPGSWIANITLKLFGLASFYFPAVCILKGVMTFCARPLDVRPSELVGVVLLLLSGAAMFHILMEGKLVLDHLPGGILGEFLTNLVLGVTTPAIIYTTGGVLTLFGLLLVTNTGLLTFARGTGKLLAGLCILVGRCLIWPFRKLSEAYREWARRPKKAVEVNVKSEDPLEDPLFEETADDLLGGLAVEDEDAQEHEATPSAMPSDESLDDEAMSREIAAKLDEDEASESDSNEDDAAQEHEASPEHESLTDQGSTDEPAEAPAKPDGRSLRPRRSRPRRDASVPAIEPRFNFGSIVDPSELEADAPSAGKPASQEGILGDWKPRTIRPKNAVPADPVPADPAQVPNALQKSYAPETAMDTLAAVPSARPIRGVTRDILRQCDESLPDNAFSTSSPLEASTVNKTGDAEPSPEQKPVPVDRTGCVAPVDLEHLIRSSRTPEPRDILSSDGVEALDVSAFFAHDEPFGADAPSGVESKFLLASLDDIRASGPSRSARDIMTSPTTREISAPEAPSTTQTTRELSSETPTRTAVPRDILSLSSSNNSSPATVMALETPAAPRPHISRPTVEAPASVPDVEREKSAALSDDSESAMPAGESAPSGPKPGFVLATAPKSARFSVEEGHHKATEDEIEQAERERRATENRKRQYQRPPLSLLHYDPTSNKGYDQDQLEAIATRIEDKLAEFNILGEIVNICPGPVVTRFEFKPAPGTKVSKIPDLSSDLMMALEIMSIRILAPIPGKPVVGIEIPNEVRNTIYLKEVLASDAFMHNKSTLTIALGQDTEGNAVVSDLARMPHLLVAGTTGSGKSVAINTMICSILYNATPDDVRMILVDPKCLEFSIYDGIPHLLTSPITTPSETQSALDWACEEMERRYRLMSDMGTRNILNYNAALANPTGPRAAEESKLLNDDGSPKHKHLPYIVIIVDEFADLMMVARKEIETQIARLAQKARAAGIHLILATQRPSTNVITGIIKANFPSRLGLKVGSYVDSRTILDHKGAETLLGRGDSLFLGPNTDVQQRVHGCFVSDDEVQAIVDFLCEQGAPEYDESITSSKGRAEGDGEDGEDGDPSRRGITDDPVYQQAIDLVRATKKASTSALQRELGIGYPKAGKIISQMEKDGLIGPADSKHNREVYI